MRGKELSDYIIRRISLLGLTKDQVAKRAGVSRQALYKLLGQDVEQAKLSTFIQLAKALEVHPLDLIRRALPQVKIPVRSVSDAKYLGDYTGFVRDVTVPDNAIIPVGQEFEKIWQIQNLGEVAWEGRRLICVDEEIFLLRKQEDVLIPLSPRDLLPLEREVAISTTRPKETVQISVRFRAPDYPCTTISYWKMVDEKGGLCFPHFEGLWCKVKVVAV